MKQHHTVLKNRPEETDRSGKRRRTRIDDEPHEPTTDQRPADTDTIDEILDQSFPASDPPPWSGSHAGTPRAAPTGPKPVPGPVRNDGGNADGNDDHVVTGGEQARQGAIIFDTPAKRRTFIGVLIGCMIIAAIVALAV